jgi:hypothetical protein
MEMLISLNEYYERHLAHHSEYATQIRQFFASLIRSVLNGTYTLYAVLMTRRIYL